MIFRIRKNSDNPYVMVNKGFVYDSSLSAKAKGILLYLLSRPDDWQVYETELLSHFSDGRDSIRSGIQELIQSNYVHRQRFRDPTGKLRHMTYDVFEYQVNSDDLTKDGFSYVGKTPTTNIEYTNNDDLFSSINAEDDRQQAIMDADQAMLNKDLKRQKIKVLQCQPPENRSSHLVS